MMRVEMPRAEFPVDYPSADDDQSYQTYTALYRNGCGLEEGLETAYELNPAVSPLFVVSAGCANGAEADGVLSLHARANIDQDIEIYGFDVSARQVQRARSGRYLLPIYRNHPKRLAFAQEVLEDYGFVVETEPVAEEKDQEGEIRQFAAIDSANLRAGHTVKFDVVDIASEPLPVPRPANLIFANNILYYFDRADVMNAARNIGRNLAKNGVFITGSMKRWVPEMTEILSSEFGIEMSSKRYENRYELENPILIFVKQ
jgi:chemotaxis methyl-accepting protein methylase